GPNAGGLAGTEAPTGPLMLQGAHAAVAFRNIRITPRSYADETDSPLADAPGSEPVLRLTGRDFVELADTSDVMASREHVWLDDAPPPGAKAEGTWDWVSKPQPVFSGEKSLRVRGTGIKQCYFDGAEPRLRVGEGDRYVAYVYLDPKDPP